MLQQLISGAVLLATGITSAAVGAVLWQRQDNMRGRLLALILFVASYYALVSGLESVALEASLKILLSKLEHVAINALGILFMLLARSFVGPEQRLSTRLVLLLAALPALNVAMAATNEWHSLIWRDFAPGPPASGVLVYHYGPWFFITLGTVYAYLAAATIGLFRWARRQTSRQRRQVMVVLAAMAIPWVASVLYVFRLIPLEGLNLTPMAFAGTAAILGWSLLPTRPFDLVPLAQRSLAENLPDGMLVLDAEGRVVDTNPAADELLGVAGEVVGRAMGELVDRWPALKEQLEKGSPQQTEVRSEQGTWLEVRMLPLTGRAGFAGGELVIVRDITARARAQQALRESEERFRLLFERLADAVFITTYEGRIVEANEAATIQTGYSRRELKDLNVMEDLAVEEPSVSYGKIQVALARGETAYFEERKRRKDGRFYWTECALSPIEHGGRNLVLSVNRDVTARKQAEERLRYLSTHDPLTGAFNRAYFEEELARLERGRRFPVSIFVGDVNGLKVINDRQGHAAGDELLRRASRVLQQAVRSEDVLARIGGDEFAGLLPETDERTACQFAVRVRARLAEHNDGHPEFPLSIALGVATALPGESLQAALRAADARMYQDKSGGAQPPRS